MAIIFLVAHKKLKTCKEVHKAAVVKIILIEELSSVRNKVQKFEPTELKKYGQKKTDALLQS